MDAIILAAGYATRLYPLTEKIPKPLLSVAGKPIIEHIMGKLGHIDLLNKIYIITNDRFEPHFRQWLGNFEAEKPIEIINDQTKSNEDRLGAIGDIHYLINLRNLNDDLLVIAGDNLFEMHLLEVINYFKKRKSNVVVLYDVKDNDLAKHYGIVEIENDIVINFVEKPTAPKSTLASTGIYLFSKKTISLIKKYIAQGNNPDKTGGFIEWLHKRDVVYAYTTNKKWYDIGNFGQLKNAGKSYKEK
ncbi:nucleotidyltransferase family protein [Candidatus Woesearchaeota archaeon]|nr:nucleotidyltransferase family protein [Candidatus Woesearchaeota archaeon]